MQNIKPNWTQTSLCHLNYNFIEFTYGFKKIEKSLKLRKCCYLNFKKAIRTGILEINQVNFIFFKFK